MVWRLWRALQDTPEMHPIFQRVHTLRGRADARIIWLGVTVVIITTALLAPSLFFLNMLLLPLLYAVFNVTLNTLIWAMNICQTIIQERLRGTYDLLCLTPDGALTVNWIICTDTVNHRDVLRRSHADSALLLQVIGVFPVMASLAALLTPNLNARDNTVAATVTITGVIAFLLIDHLYSVISGVLIALLVANRTTSPVDARLWTFILYVSLQVGTVLLLLTGTLAASTLTSGLPSDLLLVRLTVPLLIMLALIVAREVLVRVLFRQVVDTLNGESAQVLHRQ